MKIKYIWVALTRKTLDPYKSHLLDLLQFDWKIFLVFYLYANLSAEEQNRMELFDF